MLTTSSKTNVVVKLADSKPQLADSKPQLADSKPQLVDEKNPDVRVVGTVRAPISVVWELFKPFGPEIMKWWPIYEWVELDPPGIDEVGAVRHFKANGRVYRERLIYRDGDDDTRTYRDDNMYTEQYELVESDVAIPIKSVITTVQMKSMGPLETEVRWSSKTQVNPLFLPLVKATQAQAYYGAIEALARYFNPATAVLEVRVVGAQVPATWGIFPPNTYVAASIGDAPPKRTRIQYLSTSPKWNEALEFNLGVLDRQISVSVWDSRVGKDALVGSAHLNIPTNLTSDWKEYTVLLAGPLTGQVTVALRTVPEFRVLRGTMSLAKTLGSSIGKYVPPLAQLGFEIGMLDIATANVALMARSYMSGTMGLQLKANGLDLGQVLGAALIDLRRAVSGVQNIIQGLAGQFLALSQQILKSINEGDLPVYEYDRYHRIPSMPDVPLENLPRMVKGLPLKEILPPHKLAGMVQRGLEYAFSEFYLVDRYKKALIEKSDPFEAFFHDWLQRPGPVVDRWMDDTEFCRQLIQGVNPLMIRTVGSMSEIPQSMVNLSAQGKSLDELISEQRLFILDYELLSHLKLHRTMVFYAPIALVYRELLEDGNSRLNLVGFQLTRNEGPNVVYTASASPPNRYLYAKIQLACADNQYHQFISHLGLAHLATEPHVIAHHNVFYPLKQKGCPHPIGTLLEPHLAQTIGINYIARQTLVAAPDVAFTDRTFSPGTAQALKLFLLAWEKYDFFGNSFPEDLASRGFDEKGTDGVQDYYYRDDGFKIWRALESYITELVEAIYPDDRAVATDQVIQQWALESSASDRADIPGFPRAITSRALLVKTLTTIIFHASAFHSAVNFPQLQYLSYVPNRPDSTFAEMPAGDADISREFIFLQGLPNFFVSNFQISFALLLTLPSDAPLSSLTALAKDYPEIHERFQDNLAKISAELKGRDKKLIAAGKQPYPYLIPEQIASSVAI